MHGMPQVSQTAALPAKTRQAFAKAIAAKCISLIFVILRVTKFARCTEFQRSRCTLTGLKAISRQRSAP
jgi:hypothetical protein